MSYLLKTLRGNLEKRFFEYLLDHTIHNLISPHYHFVKRERAKVSMIDTFVEKLLSEKFIVQPNGNLDDFRYKEFEKIEDIYRYINITMEPLYHRNVLVFLDERRLTNCESETYWCCLRLENLTNYEYRSYIPDRFFEQERKFARNSIYSTDLAIAEIKEILKLLKKVTGFRNVNLASMYRDLSNGGDSHLKDLPANYVSDLIWEWSKRYDPDCYNDFAEHYRDHKEMYKPEKRIMGDTRSMGVEERIFYAYCKNLDIEDNIIKRILRRVKKTRTMVNIYSMMIKNQKELMYLLNMPTFDGIYDKVSDYIGDRRYRESMVYYQNLRQTATIFPMTEDMDCKNCMNLNRNTMCCQYPFSEYLRDVIKATGKCPEMRYGTYLNTKESKKNDKNIIKRKGGSIDENCN